MASPAADAIIETLLTSGAGVAPVISLDSIADAIGATAITLLDIEAIFDELEKAGHRVEAEPKNPPAALKRVLATARSFSTLSGRRPTLLEIAQHSGLDVSEVRFAMLYARVLVR